VRPQEIIAKKRDGKRLNEGEIDAFVRGVTDGSWADYQITALIMAMFLNELDFEEQSLITRAMLYSGEVLEFPEIDRPIADKHSTGGVGDKTSLLIAPMAAACGVAVPMISGRGLSHTGGTLDKLESIPGYRVDLSVEQFRQIVNECGFAMSGQTAEIAPADKKIYALRNATATVPTIPLIVASIMSKKLAEGLDALVLDVKSGSGAVIKDLDRGRRLATEMVRTGQAFGVSTRALITDMGRPLGEFAGNSCEVYEVLRIMRGEASDRMSRTLELATALAAHMLVLAGIADSEEDATDLIGSKLASGDVFEKFVENVEYQGGDTAVCDDPSKILHPGLDSLAICAERDGFVGAIETRSVGNIINEIGGGRTKAEDEIDRAVGVRILKTSGEFVTNGDTLCEVFARTPSSAEVAVEKLRAAYTISDEPPSLPDLVIEVVS